MIRTSKWLFVLLATTTVFGAAAQGAPAKKPDPKAAPAKAGAKTADAKATPDSKAKTADTAAPGKPVLVATSGDWGTYTTAGKAKTCYVLAQPKDRNPAALKRDPAYIFISTRPGEHVKNEVSITMGFDVKPGSADAKAEVGTSSFALVAKGTNLWVRNAAEESQLIDAMRRSGRLTVKAPSAKGNITTDSYSLTGLGPALDRTQKECP